MKVSNDVACELLDLSTGDTTEDWDDFALKFELMQEELCDTSRWSHIYERVYKDLTTGKFYSTSYSVGATEKQDERPYEYDGEEVEFVEVKPVEKVIITYETV
jgi:hypothetical protein